MNQATDQKFLAFSEYYLGEPEVAHAILPPKQRVMYAILFCLGDLGAVLLYAALALRKQAVELPVFRRTLLLDISARFIVGRDEIAPEIRTIKLQRRHLPSLEVARELVAARRALFKRNRIFGPRTLGNTWNVTPPGTCVPQDEHATLPPSDGFKSRSQYEIWTLFFYLHRSILLANADRLRSEIADVVTVEEYTPQIGGRLSALADLGFRLSLYLPVTPAIPTLTRESLPLYSRVITENGADADMIRAASSLPVYLVGKSSHGFELPEANGVPRVGLFLSSYYTTTSDELPRLLGTNVYPVLEKLRKAWGLDELALQCHPNDSRPYMLLVANSPLKYRPLRAGPQRMRDLDIVVCGNSSVIEEALHAGVSVLYIGNLDTYRQDLGGYVRRGLVFDATHTVPSLQALRDFYVDQKTLNRVRKFRFGEGEVRTVDFLTAITS